MSLKKISVIVLGIISLTACGPETIWLRPGLDTPAQHISNGEQLFSRGKYDDALREFNRARELDPGCVEAYIGAGLVMGRKGDIEAGLEKFKQAQVIADTPEEKTAVENAYCRFQSMAITKDPQPE
jgi:tetratricopeptide (TPR) repeat protein